MTDNGYMTGVGNNYFDLNSRVNRAMAVTVLYAMAGKPPVSGSNPFSDVHSTDWFYKPIIWAKEKGITS